MDIDDILRGAETRDSDDHPQTIGEELLSQFKVKILRCAFLVNKISFELRVATILMLMIFTVILCYLSSSI